MVVDSIHVIISPPGPLKPNAISFFMLNLRISLLPDSTYRQVCSIGEKKYLANRHRAVLSCKYDA